MRMIDADAVKESIKKQVDILRLIGNDEVMQYADIIQRGFFQEIDNAPTIEPQKWIPCSERLPCDGIPVNITWVNRKPVSYYVDIKDKHFTSTGIYYRGKWFWYSWACEDLLYEYGNSKADAVDEDVEIIAWMPLPNPYKEEEDGCVHQ